MKATQRRTAVLAVKNANERLERALRTAVRCPQVRDAELREITKHYRAALRLERRLDRR